MAYVRTPEEEEQERQRLQGASAPAASASSGAAPGAAPAAPAAPKGSGYVPLQKYLEANKGAAQGMADRLASRVESDVGFGRQALDYARGSFDASRDAATPTYTTGGEKPGAYAGPTDFDAYAQQYGSPARESLQRAQDRARGVATWEGRQGQLQEAYGQGGHYGRGAQNFDNALASAAGGSRFDALRRDYGALSKEYDKTRDAANATVPAAQQAAQAAQGQYEAYAAQQRAQAHEAAQARGAQLRARRTERRGGYRGLDGYGQP